MKTYTVDDYHKFLDDITKQVEDVHNKPYLKVAMASHLRGIFKLAWVDAALIVEDWHLTRKEKANEKR